MPEKCDECNSSIYHWKYSKTLSIEQLGAKVWAKSAHSKTRQVTKHATNLEGARGQGSYAVQVRLARRPVHLRVHRSRQPKHLVQRRTVAKKIMCEECRAKEKTVA